MWEKEQNANAVKLKDDSFISEEDLAENQMAEDFIALEDEDLKGSLSDEAIAQPQYSPGEFGSGLPGMEHFRDPIGILSELFCNLYFNTDDHIIRGKENLAVVYKMADYLKTHSNTYVIIEGHCDERGPEAYNLALGTRRAQHVRSLLIQHGVNVDQLHTVSYGKENPSAFGHTPQDWAKNRRAHFKIYEK